MKLDAAYEIVDFREDAPLTGIGTIALAPGGDLRIDLTTGYGETLVIADEEDDDFQDDEDAGIVNVMTPKGRVHLQRMSLAHLGHLVESGFMPDLPRFSSEEAMNDFFLQQVRFAAHG